MATQTISDELIHAAQNADNDAMWEIVSASESLMKSLVRSVAPGAGREDADDLLQEARAALVERIRSYDSTSSAASLHSYAYSHIRRALAEAWISMSTGLTVEPSAMLRVKQELAHHAGDVEKAALAVNARHGMSRNTFFAVMEAMQAPGALDAPIGDEDGVTLAETIADPDAVMTEPLERRDLARHLLDNIAVRQAYTLRSHYGITMTRADDEDVAAHLRVTKARVRTLRRDGVKSARAYAALHDIAA